MPRLRLWRRGRGDRGAVAALVGTLLTGGVLLGAGALAIDVGQLWIERTQLVAGADAAAVGVAKVCIANDRRCGRTSMDTLADRYASRNSTDNRADAVACARLRGVSLGRIRSCGWPSSNLELCQGSRPRSPAPYVEVRTITERPDNRNVLPFSFASAITGGSGTTVRACARVTWGPVQRATSGPSLAVCRSAFDAATYEDGERVFEPTPVHGDHDPAVNRELALRWRPGGDTGCGSSGPNGTFMFIARHNLGDAHCPHQLVVGATEGGTDERETPAGCAGALVTARDDAEPVPVVVVGTDQRAQGIAMFVVTGWRTPATGWGGDALGTQPSSRTGFQMCPSGSPDLCVSGYFTTKILLDEEKGPLSADHFGAVYVKTIG